MKLKIDVELDYATEGEKTVLLAIEAADLPDQRILKSALDISNPISSVRVPADEGLGTRSWIRIRDRLTASYSAEVETLREAEALSELRAVPLHELPGEVVKFLMPSRYCHSDLFQDFVASEFGSLTGGPLVATIRDWVEESSPMFRVPATSVRQRPTPS